MKKETPITDNLYENTKPKLTAQQYEVISNMEIQNKIMREALTEISESHDSPDSDSVALRALARLM